jgi:hypothetical protein
MEITILCPTMGSKPIQNWLIHSNSLKAHHGCRSKSTQQKKRSHAYQNW